MAFFKALCLHALLALSCNAAEDGVQKRAAVTYAPPPGGWDSALSGLDWSSVFALSDCSTPSSPSTTEAHPTTPSVASSSAALTEATWVSPLLPTTLPMSLTLTRSRRSSSSIYPNPGPQSLPTQVSVAEASSATSSTSASSPTATPSNCPEQSVQVFGNFTINFDDEPISGASNANDTSDDAYPPVFNPYHRLFFSDGYAHLPPPNDPFPPHSGPQLAIFLPSEASQDNGSPSAAGDRPGELGAGPRAGIPAFWFNAYSLWIGCNSTSEVACDAEFRGYSWDATTDSERLAGTQHAVIPACPGLRGCRLRQVLIPFLESDGSYTPLSGLQLNASVAGQPEAFFVDDIALGWVDNSCTAGQMRSRVQV